MPLQDELTAAQRCLDDLSRTIGRMEQDLGGGLEVRRVRSDLEHLRESLALLRDSAPRSQTPSRPEMVTVPDAPYDSTMWSDADDEGLGARGRHAY